MIISEWESQERAIYEDAKFDNIRVASIINYPLMLSDATFLI